MRHSAAPEAYHFGSGGDDSGLRRTGRYASDLWMDPGHLYQDGKLFQKLNAFGFRCRPFGGLIQDMKDRYPLYLSDIKDGMHLQCFASIIFLYFACITPIVTFGGLLGIATDGWMVSETRVGEGMRTARSP